MNDRDGWILVAGYGSIGRRHFRNLKALGYDDVRLVRSGRTPAEGFETPPGTPEYTDLDAALADGPAAVVVATPTALHAGTTRAALRAGACVVLEKPVCADLDEAQGVLEETRGARAACSMAYVFRYHPLYRSLRSVVRRGMLGRVFHARAWQASYLPDWHPWEDYRTSYAARSDLGGGVVRTLDHDLDLVRWMFGHPTEVMASAGTLSGLDLHVEDTADMIFRFSERMQAHVHVCFGRRDYARGVSVVGEDASAILDWSAGTLTVTDGTDVRYAHRLPETFDLNDVYRDMMQDALEGFATDPPAAVIPLSDGVAALEMATAALRSSRTSRAVPLEALHAPSTV